MHQPEDVTETVQVTILCEFEITRFHNFRNRRLNIVIANKSKTSLLSKMLLQMTKTQKQKKKGGGKDFEISRSQKSRDYGMLERDTL